MSSSDYIPLRQQGPRPVSPTAGATYIAAHALNGTLGAASTDGIWHTLRNTLNSVGKPLLDLSSIVENGMWLSNSAADATRTGFALHPPGDTHPSFKQWLVEVIGPAIEARQTQNIDRLTQIAQSISDPIKRQQALDAVAKTALEIARKDALAVQNFIKEGLASRFDPLNPDKPFLALHDSDPRLPAAGKTLQNVLGELDFNKIAASAPGRLGLEGYSITGRLENKAARTNAQNIFDPEKVNGAARTAIAERLYTELMDVVDRSKGNIQQFKDYVQQNLQKSDNFVRNHSVFIKRVGIGASVFAAGITAAQAQELKDQGDTIGAYGKWAEFFAGLAAGAAGGAALLALANPASATVALALGLAGGIIGGWAGERAAADVVSLVKRLAALPSTTPSSPRTAPRTVVIDAVPYRPIFADASGGGSGGSSGGGSGGGGASGGGGGSSGGQSNADVQDLIAQLGTLKGVEVFFNIGDGGSGHLILGTNGVLYLYRDRAILRGPNDEIIVDRPRVAPQSSLEEEGPIRASFDVETGIASFGFYSDDAQYEVARFGDDVARITAADLVGNPISLSDVSDWSGGDGLKVRTVAFGAQEGPTVSEAILIGGYEGDLEVSATYLPGSDGPSALDPGELKVAKIARSAADTANAADDEDDGGLHAETIAGGAGEIGAILGSQIGSALAGDNVFARVAASTVLSATLKTVGEGLGAYIGNTSGELSILEAFNQAATGFGNNLAAAFQSQAIGAISGFLTGELAESLGLKGFGGGLFPANDNASATHDLAMAA